MSRTATKTKIKVCYVLSYKSPDYIRTRVLVKALEITPNLSVSIAINSTTSVGRYLQTLWRLFSIRLTKRPDVYLLGFRGQEIYWPVRLLTLGKPLVFDEFINMHDWLGEENNKLPKPLVAVADTYERAVLSSCRLILTDTKLGAQSSHQTYGVPLSKYRTIYVGADETMFYPRKADRKTGKGQKLEVFFYGNMAPLHGLTYILEAADQLRERPIHFTLVGGKGKPDAVRSIKNYINSKGLSNITYREWASFDTIPDLMADCDIFLGGPFGNTSQSQRVVTGKTFQALAMSVPTVIGGINEITGFVDKKNCLLIEQGSSTALAEALTWAAEHRSQLADIGRSGRDLYEHKFAIKVVSEQMNELLVEIYAKSGRLFTNN